VIGTLILILTSAAAAADTPIAIENVNLITMVNEGVLQQQTIIIRQDRIAEFGPAARVKAPAGAIRIEGAGKYLMPGFAEMHGHLPGPAVAPEVAERILFLYLANGVTTVRGMLGHPSHLELRNRIRKGALLGPTLYLAGPALSGQTAPTPEQAARMVREQKAAGYDLIKVQEGLKPEVYESLVKTAKEVGIRFGGHVPNDVGLIKALNARQSSIDHLDNFLEALEPENSPIRNSDAATRARKLPFHIDESRIPQLARAARQTGAWVVPTMALWEVFNSDEKPESLAARPENQYMPRSFLDQWLAQKLKLLANLDPAAGRKVMEVRRKILAALRAAGAGIMFGTDSPQVFSVPGFSIHREIPVLLASGLSIFDILVSGTRNPALYFDAQDEFGVIGKGKRADLIMLAGNPLSDLKHLAQPAGVVVRGRWIPEAEIRAKLKDYAANP
jgi:imidazolonepropionase-like amidohydrolase